MAKPTKQLDWVTSGDPTKVIEPSASLKTNGYSDGERPANQHHNWIFYNTDQWVKYLEGVTDQLLTDISGVTGLSVVNAAEIISIKSSLPHYASNGDFYEDSGAADAYVLSATESKTPINAYSDGDRIRFIPDNTNTGASTVNINSLGVKSIVYQDDTALSGGEIVAGKLIEIVYSSSLGKFFIPSIDNITYINYENNSAESITANTTDIPFGTQIEDTKGEWDGNSFTPDEDGRYSFKGVFITTKSASSVRIVNAYINSVLYRTVGRDTYENTSNGRIFMFSFEAKLETTQTVSLRISTSETMVTGTSQNWILIRRIK